jgi:aminopeptidase
VFATPLPDAVEGTAYFDLPSCHAGRRVEGVRLVFRGGRVVEASARQGEEVLHGLLQQVPGACRAGEVALGCNYAIPRVTGHPLLDEKMGGTVHLALGGPSHSTAGTDPVDLHWDLVADLRLGGRIRADGSLISKDGRFLARDWPQPESSPKD